MKRVTLAITLVPLVALVIAGCGQPQEELPPPEAITLGLVLAMGADPTTPALLEAALEADLDRPVEVEVFETMNALQLEFVAGGLDLAHFGPSATADVLANADASLLAIVVRGGGSTYRSQFNARCDLGATSLTDLEGLRFGFVAAGSTSGHLVPYVTLLDAGLDPEVDLTTSFAGGHDAVVLGIYQDDLDAGATFEGGRASIIGDHPDVNDVVCVIGYSDPIPNDGIVARSGLDTSLVEAAGAALMGLSSDAEGQAALGAFGSSELAAGSADLYDILQRVNEVFFQ